MDLSLITIGVLIIIAIFVLRAIIHIVPEYQRLIVFRLGSFEKVAGPGIVLLLPPPIQSVAQTVDLREFVVEIPQQTCITKDNAPISIDFLIYQKVVDPKDSFLNIQNFRQAIQGIATTTLRAVVGNIPLDDVLAKREQINEELRVKLDDITHRWGVKVTNVEIKELTPPRDVQDAMNRQLTAERTRRAVVTEAEGKKASQILVADGAKQAAILEAEGARQSAILRAEGFALAISTINAQAMTADAKTMTLQYLDALKQLGASPSTKFIIPTEFTNLAAPLSALAAATARSDGGEEKKKG
ncbi:MAG: SPFH/Band 7/PHB domain protein [Chloroflexi bacterium]|nr:MAG: SPFH/Band 7/PHB domain protein [Chloroflexota bacterium]